MPRRRLGEIVRDQELLHVTPDTTVRAVAMQMTERDVATVLVLADGALEGIFTERDMLQRVVAPGFDPDATPIAEVMTSAPQALDAKAQGFEAVRLMQEGGMHHIVVSGLAGDGGPGYGVVSMRDIFGKEMADFESEIEFEKQLWEEI